MIMMIIIIMIVMITITVIMILINNMMILAPIGRAGRHSSKAAGR